MTESVALDEIVRRNTRPEVVAWLADFVGRNGGFVGSVHLPADDGRLALVAAHNLPPAVQNGAALISAGKGLAGAAAERKAPIVLGDLQADTSGVARPGARNSLTKGSVTVPVLADDGESVLAIVGLGFADERGFTDAEIARYSAEAKSVLDIAG